MEKYENIQAIEEKSKDGKKVIKIISDNRELYVGSKYNVQRDIDNFIKEIEEKKDVKKLIIFGLAAGEHIREIIKRNFSDIDILIVEPCESIVELMNKDHDFINILKNNNIKIVHFNKKEIYKELNTFFSENDINRLSVQVYANYASIFRKEIDEFYEVYKSLLIDKNVQKNTRLQFGKTWFNSLVSGFKFFATEHFVSDYKDKYKNVPAIIVSAGPSLSKNIKELQKVDSNFLILPGGRTVKHLMDIGVKPSFLTIVDPGEISYTLVEDVIEKIDTPLVCYEGTNKKVLEKHKGEKILFTQQEELNRVLNKDIGNLSSGGSVAHISTMFALKMGCNPIIFIGQDCAYTGDKLHADEVYHNGEYVGKIKVDIGDSYVPSVDGGLVRTSIVLDGFRRYMETIVYENKDVVFINATEGGARIEGTIEMPLKDVLCKYGKNKINNNIKLENINVKERKEKIKKFLIEYISNFNIIIDNCNKGIVLLQEFYNNVKLGKKIDKDIKKLNLIDKVLEETCSKVELINDVIYPITYQLANNEDYIIDSNEEETIKVEKYYNRNNFLYTELRKIIKESIKVVENALKELEGDI